MLVWRKINRVYIKFRFSRRRWLRLRYSYCEGMCDRDPQRLAVLTRTLAKFVSVSRTIEENLLSHSILQRSEQNCKEICQLAMQSKDAHLLISDGCRHTLRTYLKQTTRCPLPRRRIDAINFKRILPTCQLRSWLCTSLFFIIGGDFKLLS